MDEDHSQPDDRGSVENCEPFRGLGETPLFRSTTVPRKRVASVLAVPSKAIGRPIA
jgi:hypothetical protein